jgi:hypothetical protein
VIAWIFELAQASTRKVRATKGRKVANGNRTLTSKTRCRESAAETIKVKRPLFLPWEWEAWPQGQSLGKPFLLQGGMEVWNQLSL